MDKSKLAYVKKYNYKKNFWISVFTTLVIGIPILSFFFLLFFFAEFETVDEIEWYNLLILAGAVLGAVLIVVIMEISYFYRRMVHAKIFNRDTPEYYISYNVINGSFMILDKEYPVEDIEDVKFRYIKKNDIFHYNMDSPRDNGINREVDFIPAEEMGLWMRTVCRISNKKTNVGEIFIYLKDGRKILLQRVLDVEEVSKEIKNISAVN